MKIDVEIGASNVVRCKATTARGLARILKGCQGRCFVEVDGVEVYYGPVPQWTASQWQDQIDVAYSRA